MEKSKKEAKKKVVRKKVGQSIFFSLAVMLEVWCLNETIHELADAIEDYSEEECED